MKIKWAILALLAMLASPVHTVSGAQTAEAVTQVVISIQPYLSISSWTVTPSGPSAFSLTNTQNSSPTQTITVGATVTCNYSSAVTVDLVVPPGNFQITNESPTQASIGPVSAQPIPNIATFSVGHSGSLGEPVFYDVSMDSGVVIVKRSGSPIIGIVVVTLTQYMP